MRSLEAALWAFYRSNTFEKGALLAANLGDDADTTAAVFGQLGGAFYGVDAIPAKWLAKLAMRELIEQMADDLLALSAQKLKPMTARERPPTPPERCPKCGEAENLTVAVTSRS